jgi:hypothetical protein
LTDLVAKVDFGLLNPFGFMVLNWIVILEN